MSRSELTKDDERKTTHDRERARDRDADHVAAQIEADVAAGRMTLEEGHNQLLQHNTR